MYNHDTTEFFYAICLVLKLMILGDSSPPKKSLYCYKIDSNNSHSPYCCLEWHQSHVSLQIFPLHFHFQTSSTPLSAISFWSQLCWRRERFYLLSFIAQIYFESLSSLYTKKTYTTLKVKRGKTEFAVLVLHGWGLS